MSDLKLQHLKAQADALGVKYHHKAGIEKIQKAIDDRLQEQAMAVPTTVIPVASGRNPEDPDTGELVIPLTETEFNKTEQRDARVNANRLIRCQIQCMNPNKREWPGEIISVGSAKLGTFKKYIPFRSEPYHIPKIIYDMLLEKKCSVFYNAVDGKGHKIRKSRLINEYSITVLPPLTPEELKTLAHKQALQNSAEA